MLFILFVVYAALGATPEELIVVHTEFPLTTLEECTNAAVRLATNSVLEFPELAPYKTYQCQKESI